MTVARFFRFIAVALMISLTSISCVRNNGQKLPVPMKGVVIGAGIGASVGAVVGSVAGNTAAGAVIGGATGSILGMFRQTPQVIIGELQKMDIQYVAYGDTHVLIIPTDKYFEVNTHRFVDKCYIGLMNIVRLLRFYPCSMFYVAGFTDDIGSRAHKNKLSESRADALVTFLWAHDVRAYNLRAEGYGDKFPVGDNHLMHGSAYNRRVEIQWINIANCTKPPLVDDVPFTGK